MTISTVAAVVVVNPTTFEYILTAENAHTVTIGLPLAVQIIINAPVAKTVTVVAGSARTVVINAPLADTVIITAPLAEVMSTDAPHAKTITIVARKKCKHTMWRKEDSTLTVNESVIKKRGGVEKIVDIVLTTAGADLCITTSASLLDCKSLRLSRKRL